jgi:hypothetical protein
VCFVELLFCVQQNRKIQNISPTNVCVSVIACVSLCLYECVCVSMRECVSMCVWVCVCVSACVSVSVWVSERECESECECARVCEWECVCVCECACACVFECECMCVNGSVSVCEWILVSRINCRTRTDSICSPGCWGELLDRDGRKKVP